MTPTAPDPLATPEDGGPWRDVLGALGLLVAGVLVGLAVAGWLS